MTGIKILQGVEELKHIYEVAAEEGEPVPAEVIAHLISGLEAVT